MSETLLPCPFCGGEDIHVGWTDFDSGVIFVECETCGMYCEPKDCYANEPKAIEAWNTRVERMCKWTPADYVLEGDWWNTSCGASITWEPDGTPDYCPSCGAKVVD